MPQLNSCLELSMDILILVIAFSCVLARQVQANPFFEQVASIFRSEGKLPQLWCSLERCMTPGLRLNESRPADWEISYHVDVIPYTNTELKTFD